MLGAHGVVYAVDSAFQETPKTINRVGVNIADDVHFRGVPDSLVPIAEVADLIVAAKLVSINRRPASNRVTQEGKQGFGPHIHHLARDDSTSALHDSRYRSFAFRSASALPTSVPADVSFVHFDVSAKFSAFLV